MGHYLADLMCNRCGRASCRCQLPAAESPEGWVLDDDFSPITASAYVAANNRHGLGLAKLHGTKQRYFSREIALRESLPLIERAIDAAKRSIERLEGLQAANVQALRDEQHLTASPVASSKRKRRA